MLSFKDSSLVGFEPDTPAVRIVTPKAERGAGESPPCLHRGFLSLGIMLILVGIGSFIAHYWHYLANGTKLSLAAALILVALAATTWAGLDRFLGKLLLLVTSALVGVYIGIFAQIYQNGSESYQMFTWWAVLIIPWAVLGRFTPLLILWLGLLNLALAFYWPASSLFTPLEGHLVFRYQTISLVLLNGLALCLREWAAQRRSWPWLDHGWSALALLTATLIPASMATMGEIASSQSEKIIACGLYAVLLITLGLYYSRVRYSLPSLSIVTLGAYVVLTSLAAHGLGLGRFPSTWPWLDAGLGILGLFIAGIAFFSSGRLLGGIKQLANHLSTSPWYLSVMISIGAWVLSLLVLIFATILIGPQPQSTIRAIGITLLVVAVAAGRRKWGLFTGQCALAASLAAQVIIYCGFANNHRLPLVSAAALSVSLALLLYLLYPNFLSRLVTCLIALQLVLAWIYADPSGHFSRLLDAPEPHLPQLIPFYWALHLAAIYWCLLRHPRRNHLTPLGLAVTASLAAWQVGRLSNILPQASGIIPYLQTALTALALFSASLRLGGGAPLRHQKAPLFIGLALALAALVYLNAGGTLLVLLIMLLGFLVPSRAMIALSLILFPISLTFYFFNHNLYLLTESGVLIVSGLAILLLRTALFYGQQFAEL